MLVLRCPEHPTYKAVHKPKVNCSDCNELYERVQGNHDRREQQGKVHQVGVNVQMGMAAGN